MSQAAEPTEDRRPDPAGEAAIRPVRAVMASDFTNWATGEGIAFGLRSRGWMIAEVDRSHYLTRGDGVLRATGRLLRGAAVTAYNKAILTQCERLGARVFLTIKGSLVHASTIAELRRRSVVTAIYYTDRDFDRADVDLDVIRSVDAVFTTKSFQMDWLTALRGDRATHFLAHGYPTLVELAAHPVPAEADYLHDLAYVGNPDPEKLQLLQHVAAAFPGKSLLIAGNKWKAAANGTALAPVVKDHPLVGDFLAEAHRLSRINLAFHMGNGPNGWADLVSRRTFEIPAFRGLMLHVDNAEVRSLYDVPGEIDVFREPAELIEKIGFYLGRPELRRKMIDRALKRAVPAYGHHSRGVEMDSLLRPLLDEKAG